MKHTNIPTLLITSHLIFEQIGIINYFYLVVKKVYRILNIMQSKLHLFNVEILGRQSYQLQIRTLFFPSLRIVLLLILYFGSSSEWTTQSLKTSWILVSCFWIYGVCLSYFSLMHAVLWGILKYIYQDENVSFFY